MARRSAGLLLYRRGSAGLEVLLAHPGGPFWARRDLGSWSIPKGEIEPGEEPADAALREFEEELGARPAVTSPLLPLGEAVQPSRKIVTAFAAAGAFDPATLVSAALSCEWPPRSGRSVGFPEIDRAEWFAPALARTKILPGQAVFLDRLAAAL